MMVFNRKNPTLPQILELDDLTLLQQSNYDNRLRTKFFAHGLNGSPRASYPTRNGSQNKQKDLYLPFKTC